jgi:hypothetical protein
MQKFETLDAERVVNTNTDDDVERVFDPPPSDSGSRRTT